MMPTTTTTPYGGGIIHKVYDNTYQYRSGIFDYYQEDKQGQKTFSSPPQAPKKKASRQRTLDYQGDPSELQREKVLRKIDPGKDGRFYISNTTELPYSIHVKLKMAFCGQPYGGSGSLVGPHHVLTCGHNIYDPDTRTCADEILVYPALNKTSAPFGVVKVVKAYTFTHWTEKGDEKFDIALLILNQSIGSYTGWGGLISTHDTALSNEKIHVTGYPGELEKRDQMWSMSHTSKTLHPERFDYEIDTSPGQSGSAIWIKKYALPMIIGVHTRGSNVANSGVRISAQKFTELFVKVISETRKIEKASAQTYPALSQQPILQLATSNIQQPIVAAIPAYAFGKAKWASYFGDIGKEPPLPVDIHQILEDHCPIWPGKKVKETHMLVLIPVTVDEKPLTLKLLGELVQKPKIGRAAILTGSDFGLSNRYQDKSVAESYWVLMTKDILKEYHYHKSYKEQCQQIKDLVQKTGISYTTPKLLEAATCILMHQVATGLMLYTKGPRNYIRCEEQYREREQSHNLCLGMLSHDNSRHINISGYLSCGSASKIGVGVLRRWEQ